MTERALILSGPEVRAVQAGTKTQLRRLIALPQFQRTETKGYDWIFRDRRRLWNDYTTVDLLASKFSRYGQAGDMLWVQEAFTHVTGNGFRIHYRADGELHGPDGKLMPTKEGVRRWASPAVMPRDHARITLQITEMRVQKLQDISEADARAEGVTSFFDRFDCFGPNQGIVSGELVKAAPFRESFACTWDEINGDRALWESNPWVWAISFSVRDPRQSPRMTGPGDEVPAT